MSIEISEARAAQATTLIQTGSQPSSVPSSQDSTGEATSSQPAEPGSCAPSAACAHPAPSSAQASSGSNGSAQDHGPMALMQLAGTRGDTGQEGHVWDFPVHARSAG